MKTTPIKPWSLLHEDSDPRRSDFDAVAREAAAEQMVTARSSPANSRFRRMMQLYRPTTAWALIPLAVATLGAILATLVPMTSAVPKIAFCLTIVSLNLLAGAVVVLVRRQMSQASTHASNRIRVNAGVDSELEPMSADLQPVWAAVEQHTASIQRRLDEVLEEHSRMSLEMSLATTQKQQSEAILDAVADPVLVIDGFGQVVLLNPAAEELLGVKRRDVQRSAAAKIIRDEKLQANLAHALEADSRAAKRRVEHEINSRDYAIALAPLGGDECADASTPNRHGIVAVFRDITKEREASRSKSEFVSHAAHELRTPLSAIRAYVEMLVDGEAADEKTRTEYYDIIQTSADRLGRMIDNILNISRIEAGTVRINKAPVAISMLVKQAADTMRPQAEQKHITLTEELAPVVDRILADRDLIEQAILNLLSNAIKYTPEGGRVNIRMISLQDNRFMRIEVSDSGAGIPKQDIPRMFEKFFRVEANKKLATGTGLGLSLVKQIVETVHGGEMSLTSEEGKGSAFAMTLPLYDGTCSSN